MTLGAPLYAIAGAPVPDGASAEWLIAKDGVRLRAALFKPSGGMEDARGTVVLNLGRTEPIEKYFEVIKELQARGFAVVSHDWRGQGLSDRALADRVKGHAKGWRPFLSDLNQVLAEVGRQAPKPWIALGNSMGGGLTLLALAEGEDRFAAAILTAPMLGILTPGLSPRLIRVLSVLNEAVGLGQTYLWSKRSDSLGARFEDNILTHDRVRWERGEAIFQAVPDLVLGYPTWGWLAFATALTARLSRSGSVERIAIPLTIVTAGEDRICDSQAAAKLAARAPLGRCVEIEGAYHEILQETDDRRRLFWRAFDDLADQVAPR
jgi:lysophospholipase